MPKYIRQRGKTWQLQYRKKGGETINATFDSEAAALRELEAIKARRTLDIEEPNRKARKKTLRDLFEDYEITNTPGKKGAARELARIAVWKKHKLAARFLHLITAADVADYLVERRKEKVIRGEKRAVSEGTIRLELMLLSSVYKFAILVRKHRVENPVKGMMRILNIGKSKERDRRLRPDEEKYLFAALEEIGAIHLNLTRWAIETAMRKAEILKLTWADVEGRHIRIQASKSGKQNVRIPISTRAAAIIEHMRPEDDDEYALRKIFQISVDRSSRAFAKACSNGRTAYERDTGKPAEHFLKDLHFHDLRHEATTRFFERGMSRAEVLTLTRHETLEMLDRYVHLDTSENSAIFAKLG